MAKMVVESALAYFDSEYNCAQSVLKAILEEKGLYFDEATQLASGLGGGLTFSGQQCGAVSAAVLAIGMIVGKAIIDVKAHKSKTYQMSSDFLTRFKEEFGTIRCDDLTGIDMSDYESFRKAADEGLFRTICPKFVEKTIRILLEMFPE